MRIRFSDLWIGVLVVLTIAIMLMAMAQAHDWYTGLKNEQGQICCGGSDCAPLADGDVSEVHGGYYIWSHMVFVPQARAQPARQDDGRYHACFYGTPNPGETTNSPKCFFVPNRGY